MEFDNDIGLRVDQIVTLGDSGSRAVLNELNDLIIEIAERIEEAEAGDNYQRVSRLAIFGGQAYRNVADTLDRGDPTALLIASSLLVASSYWDLRSSCAQMDNDIVLQVGSQRPRFGRVADMEDQSDNPAVAKRKELMRQLRSAGQQLPGASRPASVMDVSPGTKTIDPGSVSAVSAGPPDRTGKLVRIDAKRPSVLDLASSPASTSDQGIRNASTVMGQSPFGDQVLSQKNQEGGQ